jgi:hypothetical protein
LRTGVVTVIACHQVFPDWAPFLRCALLYGIDGTFRVFLVPARKIFSKKLLWSPKTVFWNTDSGFLVG